MAEKGKILTNEGVFPLNNPLTPWVSQNLAIDLVILNPLKSLLSTCLRISILSIGFTKVLAMAAERPLFF